MTNRRAHLLVGALISLLLLGWVFWRTDWAHVLQALRDADVGMLVAAALTVVAGIMLRAWRWGIMLEPQDARRPFSTLFDIVNVGYLANNILPARLGDLLRAYLAREWTRASLPFSLSTTVVERVLDTLVVVVMLFGMLPFLPVPPLAARTGLVVGALFFLAGLLLVAAAWQRDRSEWLVQRLLRPLPLDEQVWGARLVALLDGFALVRQPERFTRVLFSTLLIWLVAISSYWFAFRAFDLDLGAVAATFTISLAALGMAAPSGPAAAGTFEVAAGGALEILGVSHTLAYGVALVIHFINFIVISLLGLWSMARRGLSLGTLAARAEAAKT
jgi:glycosyltransferase 2 family protein